MCFEIEGLEACGSNYSVDFDGISITLISMGVVRDFKKKSNY